MATASACSVTTPNPPRPRENVIGRPISTARPTASSPADSPGMRRIYNERRRAVAMKPRISPVSTTSSSVTGPFGWFMSLRSSDRGAATRRGGPGSSLLAHRQLLHFLQQPIHIRGILQQLRELSGSPDPEERRQEWEERVHGLPGQE